MKFVTCYCYVYKNASDDSPKKLNAKASHVKVLYFDYVGIWEYKHLDEVGT